MKVTIIATAAILAATANADASCWRCGPDNFIGPDVTAIIGRLAAVASGRYALPPPPPHQSAPPNEEQWRARIMAEARRFCTAYPNDEVCNRPGGPPQ